jgi:hypothetical protein
LHEKNVSFDDVAFDVVFVVFYRLVGVVHCRREVLLLELLVGQFRENRAQIFLYETLQIAIRKTLHLPRQTQIVYRLLQQTQTFINRASQQQRLRMIRENLQRLRRQQQPRFQPSL